MRKYPFVKQTSYKDCGATSLFMIIQYYKGFINKEKLFEMTKTTKNGTSAYNIIKAAENLGFKSYGIKCDIENIEADKLILPAIAHVIIDNTYPHFLVVYKIDFSKKKILVADPATKLKVISFEEFNKIFTNRMIILYPIRKIPKEAIVTNQYFKRIISENKKTIALILVFINLSLIISFYSLYIFTNLLNSNWDNFELLIFFLITLKLIINYLKDLIMIRTNFKVTSNLTNASYENIISLPYRYYRNHTTGDIISRMNDIDDIRDFVTTFILGINNILLIIISGLLLYFINTILFSVSLLIAILYMMNYLIYNRKLINKIESLKRERELMNSYMTESILGFESIKGLNLENKFIKEFQEKNLSYLTNLKTYQILKNKMDHSRDYIADMSMVLIIGSGLVLISHKMLDFKSLVLFYMIFSYFIDPIKNFLELDFILKNIKLSLKRVLELNIKDKNIDRLNESGIVEFCHSDITLDDKELLKDVNLTIRPKDKIMMYGESGKGKSTILKMLKQYYDSNNIFVNQKNYNDLNFKNKIIYISQDEYLFTDTLYNNIVLKRNINKKKLSKILKMCYIEEIIKKEELGLNSLIEENGFNLSGGERQRIILARALVSNFDYLFIDEGLSEIDIHLERRILKHLLKVYQNKTIIFVSHRLDNLDLFNKTIKINERVEVLEKNKGGV